MIKDFYEFVWSDRIYVSYHFHFAIMVTLSTLFI